MDQLEKYAKNGRINEEASVMDKQSIIIPAPIQEVWDLIVALESWPNWNSQVSSLNATSDKEFEWVFCNERFHSKIAYMEEPYTFCWISKGSLLKAVHVYKLDEINENKTSIVLEGSMQGFKTYFSFNHRKLHRSFVKWLEDLSNSFEHVS